MELNYIPVEGRKQQLSLIMVFKLLKEQNISKVSSSMLMIPIAWIQATKSKK